MQLNLTKVLSLIKAPSCDELWESNIDNSPYNDVLRDCLEREGMTPEEAETKAQDVEDEWQSDLHKAWQNSIEATIENWLNAASNNKLKLTFDWPNETLTIEETEPEALGRAILDCINGHGMFHFNSLQDALDSGPYTYEEFCQSHFRWLKYYDSIYGDNSMNYDRHAKHYFRNI